MFGPWMNIKEIKLVEKYLKSEMKMFEWGAGGSTLHFPEFVSFYRSIEHNEEWFEKVKKEIINNTEIHLVPNDAPRTMPTQKHQFETYINSIDKFDDKFYDAFLIDGRARGWCAEKALDYCTKDTIVFIHDYWNRPQYHIVEKWYKVIDSVKNTQQTIVALRKK